MAIDYLREEEGDAGLLDLAFGVGHLAYADVASGVDVALGVGVEWGQMSTRPLQSG